MPLLIGLGVYAVAIGAAREVLNDGGTLSHIVIGRWIIEHRAIPFADPFSRTFRGQSWVPHGWLAELILYRRFPAARKRSSEPWCCPRLWPSLQHLRSGQPRIRRAGRLSELPERGAPKTNRECHPGRR